MPAGWERRAVPTPEPKEPQREELVLGAPQKPVFSLLSNFRSSVFGRKKETVG